MDGKIFIVLTFISVFVEIKSQANPLRLSALWNRNRIDPNFINDLDSTLILSMESELFREKNSFAISQNTTCEQDFHRLISAATQRELWALKVFDAWGKPLPSGLLKGNIFWLGNYDECVDQLYQANNRSFLRQPFDTQYCKSAFFHQEKNAKLSLKVLYKRNLLNQ